MYCRGGMCWRGGRVNPSPKPNMCHAERWLKAGAELAQRRPMPAEWYDGWDARAAAGQLSVATDEAGAPASMSNLPDADKQWAANSRLSPRTVLSGWRG